MLINERLTQQETTFSTKEPTIATRQHWIGGKEGKGNIKLDFLVLHWVLSRIVWKLTIIVICKWSKIQINYSIWVGLRVVSGGTKKLVHEISLNFPELFIKKKYVKIRFKNWTSPCYFLRSRGQKIKNITYIEQKRLFLFTFLVSYFMAFLAQKLIYRITIWFNFVFGSFFEQDHLLNLFISEVYAKKMT